jgi:hypothetical protein
MIREEKLLIGTKQELLDYLKTELKIQNKTREQALCAFTENQCEISFGESLEDQLDTIYTKPQHFGLVAWMNITKGEDKLITISDVPLMQETKETTKISLQSTKVWIQDYTTEEYTKMMAPDNSHDYAKQLIKEDKQKEK